MISAVRVLSGEGGGIKRSGASLQANLMLQLMFSQLEGSSIPTDLTDNWKYGKYWTAAQQKSCQSEMMSAINHNTQRKMSSIPSSFHHDAINVIVLYLSYYLCVNCAWALVISKMLGQFWPDPSQFIKFWIWSWTLSKNTKMSPTSQTLNSNWAQQNCVQTHAN